MHNLLGAVSGVVFFNELDGMSAVRRVAYVCGLFTAIIGIRVLTTSDEPVRPDCVTEKGSEVEPLLPNGHSHGDAMLV